jgi:hypothetical protein
MHLAVQAQKPHQQGCSGARVPKDEELRPWEELVKLIHFLGRQGRNRLLAMRS